MHNYAYTACDEKFKRKITVRNIGWGRYIIVRFKEGVKTEFRIREGISGLDIENTQTHPENRHGEGYGTEALKILKRYAKNRGHKTICARSVTERARSFWSRAGFVTRYGHNYEYEFDKQSKS